MIPADAPASPPPNTVPAASLLGCRIHQVTQASALDLLRAFCREDRPHLVVTADASMLVHAQQDKALRTILATASLVVPDSIGVVWASRFLGTPLPERVTGVDLADQLCAICAEEGWSLFLLGAAPGVADRAAEQLCRRHPGLSIAGTQHGFFSEHEENAICERIRQLKPHVLFAAMGIPRQEKWLARWMPRLPVRVGIGVGGSLDVMAGIVRRAPVFFQRTNLEWLYRTCTDLRRLRKSRLLPVFVFLTLKYRLRKIRESAGATAAAATPGDNTEGQRQVSADRAQQQG